MTQSSTTLKETIQQTVRFNSDGLIPAIVQQFDTGEVLMMAWMNEEALTETLSSGRVCYWSRSRQALWRKGESSGQSQILHDALLDCDGDTLVLKVRQKGVACHTGRRTCFFRRLTKEGEIAETLPVTVAPDTLYER